INMKGLDGIQGPIYVGTGCVFRRQALYGFDAPKAEKERTSLRSCSCWPKWCCCGCCTSRKKNKKVKLKQEKKKKKSKHSDATVPIFNLEDIEEGVE
ncbi:hypothetical protein KI387_014585, partial [Taxus chinensis]